MLTKAKKRYYKQLRTQHLKRKNTDNINLKLNEVCSRCESKYNFGTYMYNDFLELGKAIVNLICFKPNYYFVCINPDDKHNIYVCSKKQYIKAKNMCIKDSTTHNIAYYVAKVCNYKDTTLYKMIKQAIEYNPYARFLKRYTDQQILELSNNILLRYDIKIEEEDIQKCYDIYLDHKGYDSGKRFAVTSCMYKKKVGKFYNNFNVKGYKVVDNGENVGRFLLWTMENGKQYVDRLYISGGLEEIALKKIDEIFPDAEKYPNTPSSFVSLKKDFKYNFNTYKMPYIDTFYNCALKCDDNGKIIINLFNIIPRIDFEKSMTYKARNQYASNRYFQVFSCKHCGKLYTSKYEKAEHEIQCDKIKNNKNKELYNKLNNLYKEFINKINGDKNEQTL